MPAHPPGKQRVQQNSSDSATLVLLQGGPSWPRVPHQTIQTHLVRTPAKAAPRRSAVCYLLPRLKRPCLAPRGLGYHGLKQINDRATNKLTTTTIAHSLLKLFRLGDLTAIPSADNITLSG